MPLPCVTGFINQVVDLPGGGFTTHPEDSPLMRGEEIYVARLERVGWVVNLLCHVQGVVDDKGLLEVMSHTQQALRLLP